jgi:hypothetical protein
MRACDESIGLDADVTAHVPGENAQDAVLHGSSSGNLLYNGTQGETIAQLAAGNHLTLRFAISFVACNHQVCR